MLPLFRSHSAAAVMRPHLCMHSRLPTTAASLRSLAPASFGMVRRQRVMFHTSKRACDDAATAASTNGSERNESNDNSESVDALLVERASRFNNPYAMKTPAWYELQDLDSALPKDYTPPNARPLGKAGKLANSFVPEARHAQRGSKVFMDVDRFLKKISTTKKPCEEYIKKFESWEDLFTASSRELKERGIPIKQRRWILRWCEKYRLGIEPGSNAEYAPRIEFAPELTMSKDVLEGEVELQTSRAQRLKTKRMRKGYHPRWWPIEQSEVAETQRPGAGTHTIDVLKESWTGETFEDPILARAALFKKQTSSPSPGQETLPYAEFQGQSDYSEFESQLREDHPELEFAPRSFNRDDTEE